MCDYCVKHNRSSHSLKHSFKTAGGLLKRGIKGLYGDNRVYEVDFPTSRFGERLSKKATLLAFKKYQYKARHGRIQLTANEFDTLQDRYP